MVRILKIFALTISMILILLLGRAIWFSYPSYFCFKNHNKSITLAIDKAAPITITVGPPDFNGNFKTKLLISEKSEIHWFLKKFYISKKLNITGYSMSMEYSGITVWPRIPFNTSTFNIVSHRSFTPIDHYKWNRVGEISLSEADSSELRNWLINKGIPECVVDAESPQ